MLDRETEVTTQLSARKTKKTSPAAELAYVMKTPDWGEADYIIQAAKVDLRTKFLTGRSSFRSQT